MDHGDPSGRAVLRRVGSRGARVGLPFALNRSYGLAGFGSNRKTATRPASASNSSAVPSRTMPERFANATPTGTSVEYARSTGRASSGASSTILTWRDRRPRLSVPVPRGAGIRRPVGARVAGNHVEATAKFERRHRRAARATGLAARHRRHHGGARRYPKSLDRHHHLVHGFEVARRTWLGHVRSIARCETAASTVFGLVPQQVPTIRRARTARRCAASSLSIAFSPLPG
jgi:hypothetical protein